MKDLISLKLRPKKLDDIISQENLVGKDGIIRRLIESKKMFSMILYGNPGTGKTSLVWVIINELKWPYKILNATINNKKDFEEAIEEAKAQENYLLIIDEIHRMNKDKQDVLLPFIENGTITLIGMTTANPYHTINPAIRSRCQMFKLEPLTIDNVREGLIKVKETKIFPGLKINLWAIKRIADLSNGDIRFAYNLLEVAYTVNKNVTVDLIERICPHAISFQDSSDDGYYDTISALQKSIRGSDVNASLHYLARLIDSGDLEIIHRRLTVIAYEDIGLANPSIGPRVLSAIEASERLGLPEARIPLGEIVCEMALSPKSNSSHIALDEALEDVKRGNIGKVPDHIKTNSMDYKYPHNYPNNFVKQQYLPNELINKKYYTPSSKDLKCYKDTYENISRIQDI